jgi:hypothetical protein
MSNKGWLIIIIICLLVSHVLVGVIAYQLPLEGLRIEMEERGLYFCFPEYDPINPFAEPLQINSNLTIEDFDVWDQ